MAELIRESVDRLAGAGAKPTREELVERARRVAGRFSSGRRDIAREHDRELADAFL